MEFYFVEIFSHTLSFYFYLEKVYITLSIIYGGLLYPPNYKTIFFYPLNFLKPVKPPQAVFYYSDGGFVFFFFIYFH